MRLAVIMGAVLCLLAAAHAKDIVSMPEATMMGAGEFEAAYIYWDTSYVGFDHANVGEFYLGITKKFELDLDHVEPSDVPWLAGVTELNGYYSVCTEIPRKRPTLVVGATNLLGNDWLPSSERPPTKGDTRISPFAVAAMTLRVPQQGPPTWLDPAVRAQLGWGANYHEDQFFGILQVAFTPNVVAAFQHYQGRPGGLIGWQSNKGWAVHLGTLDHKPYVHFSYDVSLPSVRF
jgi:hypothetical protein